MSYSNDPQPNVYAHIPSPLPNIDFPKPYWINKLRDLLIVACLNPDIAYVAMAVPALGNMFWSVITPSTKQIVEETTGRSWICGTKQVWTGAKQGQQIASSGAGRFIYGLVAGFDIAAYHAFFLSTGAKGVADWISFAAKMTRSCQGNFSASRGLTPIGGWPVPSDDWGWGPEYFNSDGIGVGPLLTIKYGQVGMMVAWCSFSNLDGAGGVRGVMGIQDMDTLAIYDEHPFDNMFNTTNMAIVRFFTTNGRVGRDMNIRLVVKCTEAVEPRMIPVTGGCFIRAWSPGLEASPPYYSMRFGQEGQKS